MPELPYAYNALAPHISEEQLTIYHQKHHQAYVTNANNLAEILAKARQDSSGIDIKAVAKEFSFNLSGHILHWMFWKSLRPANGEARSGERPAGGQAITEGELAKEIKEQFNGFERFKKEFSEAALSCEGSSWAILALDTLDGRLIVEQIEKHSVNLIPQLRLLLVLDVWEHAYYLDYKNDRAKFIAGFWNIVDWQHIESRYLAAKK